VGEAVEPGFEQVADRIESLKSAESARRFSIDPVQLVDGDAGLIADFIPRPQSDAYFAALLDLVDWEQHLIRIHGREIASPRLSAWYGDPDAHYSYSGLSLEPRPWLPVIADLKARVETACGAPFNSVLLNLYRDGVDSMGWHSDDEHELGERPVIASLSLGATRRFRLRHRRRKELEPVAIDLESGSLLIMKGDTQRFWKHQIAKTRRVVEARVNLTFRNIRQSSSKEQG
jgi:alkylated DNA repair dioxygenase AlkB